MSDVVLLPWWDIHKTPKPLQLQSLATDNTLKHFFAKLRISPNKWNNNPSLYILWDKKREKSAAVISQTTQDNNS